MGCSNSAIRNNVTPSQPNNHSADVVGAAEPCQHEGVRRQEKNTGSGKDILHKSSPPTQRHEEPSEDLMGKKEGIVVDGSVKSIAKFGQVPPGLNGLPSNWKNQSFVQTDRTFNLMQSIYSGK